MGFLGLRGEGDPLPSACAGVGLPGRVVDGVVLPITSASTNLNMHKLLSTAFHATYIITLLPLSLTMVRSGMTIFCTQLTAFNSDNG